MSATNGHDPIDFEAIRAGLAQHVDTLVRLVFPNAVEVGNYFQVGNVDGDKGRSLYIHRNGEKAGRWSDAATDDHGDMLDLIAATKRLKPRDALQWAQTWLGVTPAVANGKANGAHRGAAWLPIMPVPTNKHGKAPDRPKTHPTYGAPTHGWPYRDAGGRLLGWVMRFDRPDGSKEVCPLTYGREGERASPRWTWRAFPTPRPLYGLPELAARPDAPVLVVEGEKPTEAARVLLPAFVVVTWPGGGSVPHLADWSPLAGRRVIIWPDRDRHRYSEAHEFAGTEKPWSEQPGHRTAVKVAGVLTAVAREVLVLDVEDIELDGADAADADALGLTVENAPGWVEGRARLWQSPDAPSPASSDVTPVWDDERKPARLELIAASDVRPEPIDWLWHGWLAAGKFQLIAGSPGTGKTTIALGMAAIVSAGLRWPDGTRCRPGSVVVWSGEDDVADSLVPRLLAHGADAGKVRFIGNVLDGGRPRRFDPATDMPKLIEAARDLPDLRLVIVDPVVSAVSGDSHKNAEVRRGLQPLADLGHELKCAVLGVTHFSKGTQGRDPAERVTGSLAFGAVARVVMATAKPAEEGTCRRLVRSKSNIGPDGGGFEYDLARVDLVDHPGVQGQHVRWGAAVEGNARELLGEVEEERQGEREGGSALERAKQFLADALHDGPVPQRILKSDADGAGHTWATVRRAREALGIEARKAGYQGVWHWRLRGDERAPAEAAEAQRCSSDTKGAQQNGVSTFGKSEHLWDAPEAVQPREYEL